MRAETVVFMLILMLCAVGLGMNFGYEVLKSQGRLCDLEDRQ